MLQRLLVVVTRKQTIQDLQAVNDYCQERFAGHAVSVGVDLD